MDTKQIGAALQATAAIAEVIRTVGEVPSGHLYAQVCGQIDIDSFKRVVGLLKRSGLVSEHNYLLKWVGPAFAE